MDEWRRYALCTQLGTELFFLRMGDNGHEAKRACAMCEVRLECLADAITDDIEHGIFGGFGRDERRRMHMQVEAGRQPLTVAAEAIANDRERAAA